MRAMTRWVVTCVNVCAVCAFSVAVQGAADDGSTDCMVRVFVSASGCEKMRVGVYV